MTSQRHWRRHGRIAIVTAFTTAIAGATLAGLSQTAAAAPASPDTEVSIGKLDDQLLTEAIQRGQRTVKVLVATEKGNAAKGIEQLTKAGGKVEYRSDSVGYARVEVPVDQVKKLAN